MKKFTDWFIAARDRIVAVRWRRLPRFAVYLLGTLLLASPVLALWLIARACWIVGFATEWLADRERFWWRPVQAAYDRLETWYERSEQ